MFAKRVQVRIASEPFEIAVAEREGLLERGGGAGNAASEGVTAGEIVEDQRIAGLQARQTLVDTQTVDELSALGIVIT